MLKKNKNKMKLNLLAANQIKLLTRKKNKFPLKKF